MLPKKGDAVTAFMAAAEAADAAAEKAKGELPDEVVKAYDLCKEEKKAAIEALETTKATEKGKKTKAKPKKEVEKSRYGHRIGTEAAALDDLFFKGTTLKDAAEKIKSNVGRVKGHLVHLQTKKGLKVEDNGKGVFKVKA